MDYKWLLIGCWKDRVFYSDVEFLGYVKTNLFRVPAGVGVMDAVKWIGEKHPEFTVVRVELDLRGDRVVHSVYGNLSVDYISSVNKIDDILKKRSTTKEIALR